MAYEYQADGGPWTPVTNLSCRPLSTPPSGPTLQVTWDGTYLNFTGDGYTSGSMADGYCDNVAEFASSVEATKAVKGRSVSSGPHLFVADDSGHFMASWKPSELSPPVLAGTHSFYAIDVTTGNQSNTVILETTHD